MHPLTLFLHDLCAGHTTSTEEIALGVLLALMLGLAVVGAWLVRPSKPAAKKERP